MAFSCSEIENQNLRNLVTSQKQLLEQKNETIKQQERHIEAQGRLIGTQEETIKSQEATIQNRDNTITAQNEELKGLRITVSNDVLEIKKKFEAGNYQGSRALVYKVAIEVLPVYQDGKVGKTSEEFLSLFEKKCPKVPRTNAVRRLYELATPLYGSLVFRHSDENGTTRWFLKLKPSKENMAHLDDPFSSEGLKEEPLVCQL